MKRLILLSGHGDIGGGEQMLLRVAETATHAGWDVEVIGPDWGALGNAVRERGLGYRSVPGASRRSYGLGLATLLGRRHDAVLWANGAFPALAATPTRDRLVVHLHQLPTRPQRVALGASLRRAQAVVVPSNFMAARLPGSVPLPNWTDDLPLRTEPPGGSRLRIGYVGRLSVDKGVDLLVDAVQEIHETLLHRRPMELLIAGDFRFVPKRQRELVASALARLDQHVRIDKPGWMDPRLVYQGVDLCVVPSRSPESFGLVAAEAMAHGCPVVVSDAGALPEVVGADHPWIFRAGDREALASTIAAASDPAQAPAVRDSATLGRSRWEELFSPQAGGRRLTELLSRLA